MRARSGEWGCSCGRLCLPDDVSCEACGDARSSGIAFASRAERTAFLRRAEERDERTILDVQQRLTEHERLLFSDPFEELYREASSTRPRGIFDPEEEVWIPF